MSQELVCLLLDYEKKQSGFNSTSAGHRLLQPSHSPLAKAVAVLRLLLEGTSFCGRATLGQLLRAATSGRITNLSSAAR